MKCNLSKYGVLFITLLVVYIMLPTPANAEKEEMSMAARIRQARETELVNIDFTEVEIRNLVKFISEVTGKNFVMNEEIKGKVTIVSPEPVTIPEASKTFESVLSAHGYSIVKSEKAYKVIPRRLARQEGVETRVGTRVPRYPPGEQVITQIVHLKYAEASEIKQLLLTLISPDSSMLAYEPTNSVIITDSRANISRLLKIINEIDKKGTQSQTQIICLENADAEMVTREVLDLLSSVSSRRGFRSPVSSSRKRSPRLTMESRTTLRIVPDIRTNCLLVIASPGDLEQIKELVNHLDIKMDEIRSGYHVYRLKYSIAKDLAKAINTIIKREQSKSSKQKTESSLTGKVSITHDAATNSVIILSNRQDYLRLAEVIKQLDIPRTQVMVEALIVEASITSLHDIGLDLRTLEQPVEGHIREFAGTNFGAFSTVVPEKGTQTEIPEGFFFGITKGFLESGYPNIGLLLQAFQKDARVNILSTPHLLTLDNEEAEITVGQEVPYQTSFSVTQQGREVNSFDYRDVGVVLKLTPHISEADSLRMELFIQIKNLITAPTQKEPPLSSKREVQTTVTVDNGSMILIGGLIQDNENSNIKMVPCLGSIPFLGNLFKRYYRNKSKTNLLIFITPHIIRSPEQLEKLTMEKHGQITDKIEKAKKKKPFYIKDDD